MVKYAFVGTMISTGAYTYPIEDFHRYALLNLGSRLQFWPLSLAVVGSSCIVVLAVYSRITGHRRSWVAAAVGLSYSFIQTHLLTHWQVSAGEIFVTYLVSIVAFVVALAISCRVTRIEQE